MTIGRLLLCSLRHGWRSQLAVAAGAALATAIVVGALGVGDSLRASLRSLVDRRLGRAELALTMHDRFVGTELANRLAAATQLEAVPLLVLEGTAVRTDGSSRVQRVQIVGADRRFWQLAGADDPLATSFVGGTAANRTLAERLDLGAGDELVLRLATAHQLPGELSFSSQSGGLRIRRCRLAAVVADDTLGRFSLRAEQQSPATLFVPLDELGRWLEQEGRANLILFAGHLPGSDPGGVVLDALRSSWTLDDLGLALEPLPHGDQLQLSSERVFLHPEVVRAVHATDPLVRSVSTYLVNTVDHGSRSSPYAFVSASDPPLWSEELGDDEVIVNRWLAADLEIAEGDEIVFRYFLPDSGARLMEREGRLTVRRIVEIEGAAADPRLSPDIPGISDAASCRDWNPGIPVDLERIRDRDETYWELHRATPKAFVSRTTAARLWSNRFGLLTAMRLASSSAPAGELAPKILRTVDPSSLGFAVSDLRELGLRAADDGIDFAQLFLGLSFFIVVAALLLGAFMFSLNLETRTRHIGALRAMGWPDRLVRRWLWAEAAVLAGVGAAAGIVGGVVFIHAALGALATVWQGAVGETLLEARLTARSMLAGAGGGAVASAIAMVAAAHRTWRLSVLDQLAGRGPWDRSRRPPSPFPSLGLSVLSIVAAVALVAAVPAGAGRHATAAFWIAGLLVLAGALSAAHGLLLLLARRRREGPPTPLGAGVARAAITPRRSMVTVVLLAVAVFLVVAVGANRRNPAADAARRDSGTGGFALYGELTIPLRHAVSDRGDSAAGIASAPRPAFTTVALRRLAGDDASCRNLHRVSQPPVLGVPVAALDRRGAFSFASLDPGVDTARPWLSLLQARADGTIPAFIDHSVMTWGLGMELGDELTISDSNGRLRRLRLTGALKSSILQGNILISEDHFLDLFPDHSGYQVLLVDAPLHAAATVRELLTTELEDLGIQLEGTSHRLADFLVVENTYLNIFLALGGLGLILGTAGISLITLRHMLGRRSELAALTAMGFAPSTLAVLLLAEHALPVLLGVGAGAVAALVAVLPAVTGYGASIPWIFIVGLIAAMASIGLGSCIVAARLALRGSLISALRND